MRVEVLRYEDSGDVRTALIEADVEDIDTCKVSEPNEQLYTAGAGPCVVMAAHNQTTHKGLVGHFTGVEPSSPAREAGIASDEIQTFEEAVQALLALGDPSETAIWLGGGAPFIEAGRDTVNPSRQRAEEIIKQCVPEMGILSGNVQIEWSQRERVVSLELDCRLGFLVVHNYPAELQNWDEAIERQRRRRTED